MDFRKGFAFLVVLLLFAAAAVAVIFPVSDLDTFWHVANGRAMAASGHIVNEEIFSYTANGARFSNHEWLAQIILFLFYRQWGTSGLIGLKVILTLVVVWILYLTARMLGARKVVAALLCLFVVIAGLSRFRERPQLFSFLGLALLQYILYGYSAGRFGKKALFFIPPIIILWDFLHGAVYGVLFLGAFVSGETLKTAIKKNFPKLSGVVPMQADKLRVLWLWTGITVLFMSANPYGFRSYDIFTKFVTGGNTMAVLTEEFLPTPLKGHLSFWFLFALTLFALLSPLKRIDITNVLVFIPFGYLAVRYNRGMEAFNLVAVPILAAGAKHFLEEKNRSRWAHKAADALIALSVIVSIGYVGYYKFLSSKNQFSFGYGLNENSFPVGSARFLEASNITGNMYNTDSFGGYLAYFAAPERKIFFYCHPTAFKEVLNYMTSSALVEKCNINYAVVGMEEELDMFLRKKFVPVYWESSSVLLVKNNEQNRDIIRQYGIRFFRPSLNDSDLRALASNRQAFPVLAREIGTYLAYRRDRRIADLFAEIIFQPIDGLSDAERLAILSSAEHYNSDSPRLFASLGLMYYKQKDFEGARREFIKVLAIDKNATRVRLNLAYVYLDMGDYTQSAKEFSRILEKDSSNAEALYGLALVRSRNRHGTVR